MQTYAWDRQNRLIEVRELASGQPLMRSRYDGMSRRRERVQWVEGVGATNRYVYDTWNVVRVLDGADTVVESYVHGPDLSGTIGGAGGIGGILSVAHEGEAEPWRFYHADGNGNVVLLTDETEQETARLEYDPFGRVLINSASEAVRYQFSSKEYDGSVGLNYYGYRFYSAGLGRWVNKDTIGERGGLNLYAFVGNSTVTYHDYLGLIRRWVADGTEYKSCGWESAGHYPTSAFLESFGGGGVICFWHCVCERNQRGHWVYCGGLYRGSTFRRTWGKTLEKSARTTGRAVYWSYGHQVSVHCPVPSEGCP
jgi:RHS repeat-associated protein